VTPILSATNLPPGAQFTDNGDGTGTFNWVSRKAGIYSEVSFKATDAVNSQLASTETITITVTKELMLTTGGIEQTAAGLVAVEAEHYSAQQPQSGYEWTAAANPGSSGSGALQAAPEDSVKLAAGAGPRLDYPVHFSYTGTHYVWVRGLGPSGNSDSLYIGLDGVPTPAVLPLYPNGDWLWRHTTWEGTVVTLNVTSPGLHTLNVWMRESGSVLDKLVLTTDANYTPTATGPAETAGATGTATVMVDPDTPTSLTVPAGDGTVSLTADPAHGTAAVNGDTIVYVPQQGYHGQDNLVFQITSPTGAVSVHTVTLQVGCSDCLADVNIRLSWNPQTDQLLGYLVYYGHSDAMSNEQLFSDLSIDQGEINPQSPAITYNVKTDLGMSGGGTACFRVKAYNAAGESDFSAPACIDI
jgi:hypothetical protein